MKNLNADLVLLGKPGVSPWGLAIKPRFHIKDDKHHSKSENRRCKEVQDEDFDLGGIPKPSNEANSP